MSNQPPLALFLAHTLTQDHTAQRTHLHGVLSDLADAQL